jgi:hypothetical protein
MTVSIRGDNHDIARITTGYIHVSIIAYRNTKWTSKLYYTNRITHTVTCCDLQGTTQWEFKDERVLRCPLGISVGNDGNVYVAVLYIYCPLVTSNRKATLLPLTTSNLLVDLS